MTTPAGDSLIRIVLVTMALDPGSDLTPEQRAWVIESMGQRTTPFSSAERAKLQPVVLPYIRERMPKCERLIEQQFSDDPRSLSAASETPGGLPWVWSDGVARDLHGGTDSETCDTTDARLRRGASVSRGQRRPPSGGNR